MHPLGIRVRPDKATAGTFASWAEMELDRAAAAHPNPGRPAVRRLNRAEYAGAIRELLALDVDVESLLPNDDSGYGFDNIGDVLTVSPTLLERYMAAAARIARLAIGDPATRSVAETYTLSQSLVQDDRMDEDLPFGSRGGTVIRHYFPLDAEYVFKIRLKRDRVNDIIGLARPHALDIRLDGARIKEFTIGGGRRTDRRSRSAGASAKESYERTADAGLEVRWPVKAGARVVGVAFASRNVVPEGAIRRRAGPAQYAQEEDIPGVGSVTISGPYNATGPGDTPSRRRIFICRPRQSERSGGRTPEAESCAAEILSTLAHRAYRGQVSPGDVETLLGLYKAGREKSGFEGRIGLALERMLLSPRFLFRIERDPSNVVPGSAYRLNDVELASRLSFFLWSSIPDNQLLDAAERGKLTEPAVLEEQTRRLLADPRSSALVSNFAGQWLHLRKMQKVAPDPELFPEFDDSLRKAFQQEAELFLESTLREDRSLFDLLNADYTFVNERLARHYQIPDIYGSHFRRVTLSDRTRRGIIGRAIVLTVTSYASRTSPTLRGKWVLENLLGSPPPLPPNNVPSLKDRGDDGRILSVRRQMEQHASNPGCAPCHAGMDPLGFALENFDAIGRWRAAAANVPIDSSGVLPDGTRFQGPTDLGNLLLSRREEFANTVTEKLLTYALGRGLEPYDAPAVRAIKREAAPDEYRWSSLIMAIVRSVPFQMRRALEP
jgi:hypothetical protein